MEEWGFWGDDEDSEKRTPKKIIRRAVWDRDKGTCKLCGVKIRAGEDWDLARKKAGRSYTVNNCFVAHHTCNISQGRMTLKQTHRLLGLKSVDSKTKVRLKELSIPKLKFLKEKFHVKVKGSLVEDWSATYRNPPTKTQYINALAKIITEKDIESALKEMPQVKKKRKRRSSEDSWW